MNWIFSDIQCYITKKLYRTCYVTYIITDRIMSFITWYITFYLTCYICYIGINRMSK